MKFKYKSILFVVGIMLASSCSDSDDWTPGAADKDTMGVFFRALEKYDLLIEADDSRIVPVSMGRINTEEAATVPLKVVECPEGVSVPASVSFAAGEDMATFNLDLSGMPSKSSGKVKIELDPSLTTIYGAGASALSMNITVSGSWVLLADDVKISYEGSTIVYPDETTQIYLLEGTERFKIPNFMNSGLDFVFTVSDKTASYPDVVPYTNATMFSEVYPDEEDEYKCWFLYDTANQTYPVWSPDGSTPLISSAMFYGTNSWVGLNNGQGSLTISAEYEDGKEGWIFYGMKFKALFNPFE